MKLTKIRANGREEKFEDVEHVLAINTAGNSQDFWAEDFDELTIDMKDYPIVTFKYAEGIDEETLEAIVDAIADELNVKKDSGYEFGGLGL